MTDSEQRLMDMSLQIETGAKLSRNDMMNLILLTLTEVRLLKYRIKSLESQLGLDK